MDKVRNLQPGDVVWMITDSKLAKRMKWGIVRSVFPDHDGVVRDCIIRYANLKPGKDPYTSPFKKTDPFKTKLCAVQNLAMMYSKEEQIEDKQRREKEGIVESNLVDIMTPKAQSIWQLQDLGTSSSSNSLTCSSKKLENEAGLRG